MPANSESINIAIITLDGHLGSTIERVQDTLRQEVPGLSLSMHPASDWNNSDTALAECHQAIEKANIIICTMLFMEPHIDAVLPQLKARADSCDAIVGAMSGTDVVKLTRMGKLNMGKELTGPMALLKKLRGSKKPGKNSGSAQMKTLRQLPKILKYIPGTAQDMRVYFLLLQCWLAGSEANIASMLRLMMKRYSAGSRESIKALVEEKALIEYPETGLYHQHMQGRISDSLSHLPRTETTIGTVGLLMLRSYILADNTKHYDAVITALEAKGLRVIPAFASGLDARPAIDAFFKQDGRCTIDALVSITGFSLVGGPAYNDAKAATQALAELDVQYITAYPSEFQSLEEWNDSARGLTPIETTLMVAIPELDGATGATIYSGHETGGKKGDANKLPIPDRVERLAARVSRTVSLKHCERAERKLGIVLFNFPPNSGAVGTAAYLAVFESLFNTLKRLAVEGYQVDVPDSVDDLRTQLLQGNASIYGTDANVITTVNTDDHVLNTPWLNEIENEWGPAPGKVLANGKGIHILGLQLGNITIGLQPGFGYEGDPMRLLFENGSTPTHAFSAFYRYLNNTLRVDALLHFGTHGALEFMPGKQSGLSSECWPERLIDDTPNLYLYAANNPSEASIAKRRSAATLISYLTPSVTEAGLYRGLQTIRTAIQQWHQLNDRQSAEAVDLYELIKQQCEELEFGEEINWQVQSADAAIASVQKQLHEIEEQVIPNGMHVVGREPELEERAELLHAFQKCAEGHSPTLPEVRTLLTSQEAPTPADDDNQWMHDLLELNEHLCADNELTALIHALDTGYTVAAPGGDVLRNKETLPTGRNIHGFDPFKLPSMLAQIQGAKQADILIDHYKHEHGRYPKSIAFVLWGSDNLKNQGIPIAQAMALMGARPRFDAYGKIAGAELIPLSELGRPRIDVMVTLSGVFRDLLPLQTRMLAEAALIASKAEEEGPDVNFVRAHTLAHSDTTDDFEIAALRVFSNADGAYGANVNLLIDSGAWSDESELADTYANRKCYAFDSQGNPSRQPELLERVLADVDLAYQNLESVELGVTQLDYYFDTLGGLNSMVKKARGHSVPTYIGDQTTGNATVRTLQEQVALETRTRMLNPKWYEGQLKHGYEGVRSIELAITNTMGWSATTGQVSPWVYNQMAQTFVLDKEKREELSKLNPMACARMAQRLIEAHERNYWSPSEADLQALYDAGDELEDRLEGVFTGAAA